MTHPTGSGRLRKNEIRDNMAKPNQHPYFRDPCELPATLPTTADFLASKAILKGTEVWADRKVVGIGEHFIAKYGAHGDQIEGDNLLFP